MGFYSFGRSIKVKLLQSDPAYKYEYIIYIWKPQCKI